jgi:hypothetical protein
MMEQTSLVCWPDRLQELLLRATILRGDEAVSAWEEWAAEADIDIADEGSVRLLPETYTNLRSLGVDHDLFRLIKGVKRRTWLQNQLLFHQAATALEILHGHGIATMVTKGPALVLRHYHDLGRRPMADFDIVLHKEDLKAGIHALAENGFRLRQPEMADRDLNLIHALSYVNETGRQFDLHWEVIPRCTNAQPFWDLATPVHFNEVTTLAPSATDLLLHVCVHGLRLNRIPPLRWVVDASVILRDSEVDWDRLVDLSRGFWLEYRMREALRYLEQFGIEIPDFVQADISKRRALSLERFEFELITGLRRRSFRTQLAILWLGFKRWSDSAGGLAHISQLPSYLKIVWRTNTLWALPWMMLKKGMRRLFLNPAD